MLSYFALYGVVFMLGILLLMLQKKRHLTQSRKKKFLVYLGKIENTPSVQQQIVECDKLYHQVLKAYGYNGTFGEILKKKPNIISDIQTIWDLHKIRNTLVHELTNIPENILIEKSKKYQQETLRLINI